MNATGPADTGGGVAPPLTTAEVPVPLAANCLLAMFKSPCSVQLVPFHTSVMALYSAVAEYPPVAIALSGAPAPVR